MPDFYEFFAGGGMARAGLGAGWTCTFANDFSPMKADAYFKNWGQTELLLGDINGVTTDDLPGQADLAWGSFPCQDLSLAGKYAGLGHRASKNKTRSGTFWPFWKLMRQLGQEGRSPQIIALENVYGTLTSNQGRDFAAISSALSGAKYRFGAMVINARWFVPQSRPRLFIIGVRNDIRIPRYIEANGPSNVWHPLSLINAYNKLTKEALSRWIWWNLPKPVSRRRVLVDLIEETPSGVEWHTPSETDYILSLMSERNLAKVEAAKEQGGQIVGTIYRRTRPNRKGGRSQVAEARFDGVAGCLRTPSGGSSRQTIIVVEGDRVRTRLLSPREAARLMGLEDRYQLPANYNDAYHLVGDGVAVPVVRHLAENIFEPILDANYIAAEAAGNY